MNTQKEAQLREAAQALADRLYEGEVVTEAAIATESATDRAEQILERDFFNQQVVLVLSQHATRQKSEHEYELRGGL